MLHPTRIKRHKKASLPGFSVLCLSLLAISGAHADSVGMADGQPYSARQFRELTLESAIRLQPDVTRTGLRVTLPRLADRFVLFFDGNVVQGDNDTLAVNGDAEYSGRGSGLGLFYTGLPDWYSMATTVRIALHSEHSETDSNLSVSGRQALCDTRLRTQTLSVVFSPREALRDNGLNGYLTLGLNNTRIRQKLLADGVEQTDFSRNNSALEAYLEAGVVYPLNRFTLYAAAGFEDTFSMSLGVRYQVSRSADDS